MQKSLLLLLCVVPMVAYSSARNSGFVWDDHRAIEKGRLIGSLRNIPTLFRHDAMFNSQGAAFAKVAAIDTYRPVTMSMFFLEHAVFGKEPRGYHLVSVAVHALNTVLVFHTGVALGVAALPALLGALAFAVHPSISEAVHWINGRSDPLCLALFLAALLLWLRWLKASGVGLALLVAGLIFLATLTKEIAYCLVVAMVLLLPRVRIEPRRWPRALAPLLFGSLVGLAARLAALGSVHAGTRDGSLSHAIVRLPLLVRDAVFSLLMPRADMLPSLFEKYYRASALPVGLSALCLIVVSALLLRGWRRGGLWPWAWASLLLTMAPIALLLRSEGWTGWGRYLYCAAAPLCLAAASSLHGWATRSPVRMRRPLLIAVCASLAIMALETYEAGSGWANDRALADAQIEDHPKMSIGYSELAYVEANEGNYAGALYLTRKAIHLAPEPFFRHHSRAAWALMKLGRRQEAFAAARTALLLAPFDTTARYLSALELLDQGKQAEAAGVLLGLLDEHPSYRSPRLTIQDTVRQLGPGSAFAGALRSASADSRYGHLAPRLRALLDEGAGLQGGAPGE